ncbi:MAG: ATP-dependent DNA helicase RecG [Oscillospiraceae bacterium]|jgi:ATP-dependent DNA helicase RecG|nr:ATP-dependent DNA helicase RecG [Oscillospiraceae bacterium]
MIRRPTYNLNTLVTELPGIARQRASGLAKLGIHTLRDALFHYPKRYEDRTTVLRAVDAEDGDTVCLSGIVTGSPEHKLIRRGMDIVRFTVADESGMFTVTFFNQPYMADKFTEGGEYTFYGKVRRDRQFVSLANPEYERVGGVVPIYGAAAAVSQKILSELVKVALECVDHDGIEDAIPEEVRQHFKLLDLAVALRALHFPSELQEVVEARRRFAFEEFFSISLALRVLRERNENSTAYKLGAGDYAEFYASLPFEPTSAQMRAIADADADMASGKAMNRLVQGDVGSGKTLVAAALIRKVCLAGYQAAFMAPTEILAEQHHATLTKLLKDFGIRPVLLRGGMTAKEKSEVKSLLRSGEARLVVGTHALISKDTRFFKLALAVVDEQHRFGVEQRGALAAKSPERPHVLVMSATPIPRTLAMIVYGDLDVSVIDELPPGRQSIITSMTGEQARDRVLMNIRKFVDEGRQVYVICSAIEDELTSELKTVTSYTDTLRHELGNSYRISPLHGRMKSAEKDAVMSAFASGEIDILVSTTVVEVGMDVPNATLIVIENAERFGLSQLHQLRGRVGRGVHQSYCVLFVGGGDEDTLERLKVFCSTTDGFKIAEADLRIRGPGEFFGSRQHGLPELKIASLQGDLETLREAQDAASTIELAKLALFPPLEQRVSLLLDAVGSS